MLCPWYRPWKKANMDSVQVSLLVLGLILVVGVQTGSGVRCYVCNSAFPDEKEECLNPTTKAMVKDCNTVYANRGLNYTYCRKSIQTVEGDYRVIRSCASQARLDRTCIERTGTKAIKLRYCECKGDLCNTAPTAFSVPVSALLVSVASGLLALLYHS